MSTRIKLGEQPDMPQGGEGPHRPELRVWTDVDADLGHHVSVSISTLWGQPQRFFDLRPVEAEQFAAAILEAAAAARAAITIAAETQNRNQRKPTGG